MKNVEKWFGLGESRKLEEQVKYNIAMACEGGLNTYYDGNNDEKMTRQEWREYIYNTLQMCLESEYCADLSENASNHLRFYGKANTLKLIDEFLYNYEDVQEYIAQNAEWRATRRGNAAAAVTSPQQKERESEKKQWK